MKQKNLLFVAFLFLCNFIYAQKQEKLPDKSGVWIFNKTVNNVDLYHMLGDCNGKRVTLLKFENKNNYKVQLSWKEVFVTEQVSDKTESSYGDKKLVLSAGQIIASKCGDAANVCLIKTEEAIPHYRADIRNFEFKDVLVTQLK